MNDQPDQTAQLLTTGTLYQWINLPIVIALLFGLAGAFFLGIYVLRRIRSESAPKDS